MRVSDTGFFFDIFLVGGLEKLEIILGESWILRLCIRMYKTHPGPVAPVVPVASVAGNNFLPLGRRFGNLIVEFCYLAFYFKASKAQQGTKRCNMTHLQQSKQVLVNKSFGLVNFITQRRQNKFEILAIDSKYGAASAPPILPWDWHKRCQTCHSL